MEEGCGGAGGAAALPEGGGGGGGGGTPAAAENEGAEDFAADGAGGGAGAGVGRIEAGAAAGLPGRAWAAGCSRSRRSSRVARRLSASFGSSACAGVGWRAPSHRSAQSTGTWDLVSGDRHHTTLGPGSQLFSLNILAAALTPPTGRSIRCTTPPASAQRKVSGARANAKNCNAMVAPLCVLFTNFAPDRSDLS